MSKHVKKRAGFGDKILELVMFTGVLGRPWKNLGSTINLSWLNLQIFVIYKIMDAIPVSSFPQ